MMIVVLIPLAVWTVAGLIALWPKDVGSHVNTEGTSYGVAGVSYPTGRVTNIARISCEGVAGSSSGVNTQVCANLSVQLLGGDDQGKTVVVPVTNAIYTSGISIGQRVTLVRIPPIDGQPAQYSFSDFSRGTPLLVVTLIFVAAVILVARWRGFATLLALAFAGVILVTFVFPALVSGSNPILVGLTAASAILFVALYAAHGLNVRTTTALVGSLAALLVTALLGWIAVRWTHLTGITAEDDYVLVASAPDLLLSSVVMCGIILAGVGVLIDVTLTQASAVWSSADTEPSARRLFAKAMRTGREHAAANVSTIAFVTLGAALPVLLLLVVYPRPLLEMLQTEQFADELVRILVASTGVVLAIPLTTAIAVALVRLSRGAPQPRKTKAEAGVTGPPDADAEPTPRQRRWRRGKDEFEDIDDFSDLREPAEETRRPPRRS